MHNNLKMLAYSKNQVFFTSCCSIVSFPFQLVQKLRRNTKKKNWIKSLLSIFFAFFLFYLFKQIGEKILHFFSSETRLIFSGSESKSEVENGFFDDLVALLKLREEKGWELLFNITGGLTEVAVALFSKDFRGFVLLFVKFSLLVSSTLSLLTPIVVGIIAKSD